LSDCVKVAVEKIITAIAAETKIHLKKIEALSKRMSPPKRQRRIQLPQMELVNYYHAADIFVLASYNESFGRVLLEAAMAKKPIIAAQYRGPLDIFSDRKSALFFNPNSTSSLVEQIVHLLENPQIAFQLGVEAYNDVNRRFSYEKNIHKIMESWNLSVVPQHLI